MEENTMENMMKSAMGIGKKTILYTAIAAVLGVTALNSYTTVDSGETVRIQNNITGGYQWHQTEGVKMKVPFMSRVDVYNSVSTIAVTDDDRLLDTASATRPPLHISFADNYAGTVEASWRVKLSTSPEKLEAMHQDVKGQRNLEGNTFLPFAKDMLNLTSDQFLAQDFMQGGKGAFKQRLQDQADNGMLVTKREKVRVTAQVADQTLGTDRSQAATAQQFIYKVVVQTDSKGVPLRRPHSLSKYGINIQQVDLGEFTPLPDLVDYVNTIKTSERERADMIAQQRKEREAAVTAQLQGETARISAKNKALMEKDKEVIQGEKLVELATIQAKRETVERQKVADLAVIDKNRELQIAEANEGIQKANAAAAKYEAQAIKQVGFAQAAVKKADYEAIDKDILISNNNRAVAEAMYSSQMNVTMPQYLSIGGESSASGSIADMSNLYVMKALQQNTDSETTRETK